MCLSACFFLSIRQFQHRNDQKYAKEFKITKKKKKKIANMFNKSCQADRHTSRHTNEQTQAQILRYRGEILVKSHKQHIKTIQKYSTTLVHKLVTPSPSINQCKIMQISKVIYFMIGHLQRKKNFYYCSRNDVFQAQNKIPRINSLNKLLKNAELYCISSYKRSLVFVFDLFVLINSINSVNATMCNLSVCLSV